MCLCVYIYICIYMYTYICKKKKHTHNLNNITTQNVLESNSNLSLVIISAMDPLTHRVGNIVSRKDRKKFKLFRISLIKGREAIKVSNHLWTHIEKPLWWWRAPTKI